MGERGNRGKDGGGSERKLPSWSIWLTRSVTMLLSASTDPSEMSRKISQTDELHFRGDL